MWFRFQSPQQNYQYRSVAVHHSSDTLKGGYKAPAERATNPCLWDSAVKPPKYMTCFLLGCMC